jgi:branched-chain amino acid transport system permease protein
MKTDLAEQLFVNGLIDGTFFALVAVSWSLIYATTKVFHFAHALTFVLAAYAAAIVVDDFHVNRSVGLAAAVVVAGLFGALIEIVLYRYLRRAGASGFSMFLASMGVFILGINLLQILVGSKPKSIGRFSSRAFTVGDVRITAVDIAMMAIAWIIVAVVLLLEHRTAWGRATVAARSNPIMAKSVGVDLNRVFVVAFVAGSVILAFAAYYFVAKNSAQPSMGVAPIMAGLIAMFLGGVGRTAGAVVGALVLGISQNMGGLWLPGHWQVIVSFVILFFVLLIKPTGLLGSSP